MQYLLLLHADEAEWDQMAPEDQQAAVAAYAAFTQALKDSGRWVASARLQLAETAQTVRTKGGRTVVMDGPFAETKEQLGGFYLIEAESPEVAAEWAARCPGAGHGVVEVRPLWTPGA